MLPRLKMLKSTQNVQGILVSACPTSPGERVSQWRLRADAESEEKEQCFRTYADHTLPDL